MLSDKLRELVSIEYNNSKHKSYRKLGEQLGINHNTLHRFIQGAKGSTDLIDKLYERYIKR